MPPSSMPPNNYKKIINTNNPKDSKAQIQITIGQSIKNAFGLITTYNIMNILLSKNKVVQENTCKFEKINLENCINNHNDCTKFMEALKRCQTKN